MPGLPIANLLLSSQGLAEHKDELGAPLCPCRHYDDKKLEAEQGFWNCPCVPMRERKVASQMSCGQSIHMPIQNARYVMSLCFAQPHSAGMALDILNPSTSEVQFLVLIYDTDLCRSVTACSS